ncbi:MAG TPA: DUF4411 family protein [Opitutaceae bacterium]|nr:DUF4411 family protein [Opitutaceae bacterium]
MYSLDTSFLMDWQARYYPLDLFPAFSARVEQLIADKRSHAVELVREELEAVGTPDLKAWATNHAGLFLPLSSDIQIEAASIEARYPDLMDPKGIHESADAYVIALAKLNGGIVVTQETSVHAKPNTRRSHFIPDVCQDLGVPCINLLGLMRREGWKF